MPLPKFLALTTSLRARRSGALFNKAARKLSQASGLLLRGLAAKERAVVTARKVKRFGEVQDAVENLDSAVKDSIGRICTAIAPREPAKKAAAKK